MMVNIVLHGLRCFGFSATPFGQHRISRFDVGNRKIEPPSFTEHPNTSEGNEGILSGFVCPTAAESLPLRLRFFSRTRIQRKPNGTGAARTASNSGISFATGVMLRFAWAED